MVVAADDSFAVSDVRKQRSRAGTIRASDFTQSRITLQKSASLDPAIKVTSNRNRSGTIMPAPRRTRSGTVVSLIPPALCLRRKFVDQEPPIALQNDTDYLAAVDKSHHIPATLLDSDFASSHPQI